MRRSGKFSCSIKIRFYHGKRDAYISLRWLDKADCFDINTTFHFTFLEERFLARPWPEIRKSIFSKESFLKTGFSDFRGVWLRAGDGKSGSRDLGERRVDLHNVEEMSRKNILIIDDEQAMLESLEELFGGDFNVFKASDGKQGLSLLRSIQADLVLLDLRLPGLDGTEVLKSIRGFSKTVPVIVMTAYSTIERAEKCAGLTVQGYIRKPFDSIELLQNVREMLNGTSESGPLGAGCSTSGSLDGLSTLVRKSMEFIESHYTEPIRPRDIAAQVFASRDYIGKKFKKETGRSIGEHLNRLRVEKAKHLLAKSDTKYQEYGEKLDLAANPSF